MQEGGSAVLEVMRKASVDSWKKWRDHVAAGTADTAEARTLYDEAMLAADVLTGELAARSAAVSGAPQVAA